MSSTFNDSVEKTKQRATFNGHKHELSVSCQQWWSVQFGHLYWAEIDAVWALLVSDVPDFNFLNLADILKSG